MNKSEISDGFNFDNELDITQNRKDKTEQYFSKEGFAFEDFMNIGDKTMKSDKMSSKYYNNTSNIFKADQDSSVSPHNIVDNLTQHSLKVKKRETSVLQNLSITNPAENILRITSPKFADQLGTSKTIQQLSKKEFTLRRTETGAERTNIQDYLQKQGSSKGVADYAFKKKEDPLGKAKEEEYKQLQNQIKYYEDSLQKMIYESERMQDETQNLMANFNSASYEVELEAFAKESKSINKEIEEERNLQVQLNKMINQLEDQYEELVNSVKSLNFPRPVKMLDETKAIVDEINILRTEFDALQRDDGSLNLSSTLLHNYSSNQPGNTFRGPQKKDSSIGLSRIQQIYSQNKRSEDPRFLHNIKMACLRDEWNIYANSQIQINVSYRNCPKIRITLGNKYNKDLEKFTFRQGNASRLQGETVSAKSYITHQIEVKEDLIDELFIRCELSYQVENLKKNVILFVPTGITTFGEFSPITEKEFLLDAGRDQFQNCGNYRPLDKKLANNITEVEYYMPNLLVDRDNYKCYGLFVSIFNDFTFLVMRQRGELVSIAAKTPNWPLIRMLEFIFTL